MIKKYLYLVAFVIVLAFIVGFSTTALGEEFYSGKTIRVVVGFPPGGGYDTYSRAVARHMGKHIPGNPSLVVANMPGAGSHIAAKYLLNKAEPNGLTVGILQTALILRQALGDKGVKIDFRKVGWIGAPSVGSPTCAVMGFTGLKTLEDVINSKKPLKMGATIAGSTLDLPKILNLTIGTKFEVIPGSGGTPGIRNRMQKREIDGTCFGWESMRTTARSILDASGDDKLIPILTHRNPQDPEVKDLPQLGDVVKAKAGDEGTAILNAWLTPSFDFQRPFSVRAGTPRDRLLTLRKAFKATMQDPEFLADAKKSKLHVTYVSGEEIEGYVKKTLAITPRVKERLQFLVTKKKKKIM